MNKILALVGGFLGIVIIAVLWFLSSGAGWSSGRLGLN